MKKCGKILLALVLLLCFVFSGCSALEPETEYSTELLRQSVTDAVRSGEKNVTLTVKNDSYIEEAVELQLNIMLAEGYYSLNIEEISWLVDEGLFGTEISLLFEFTEERDQYVGLIDEPRLACSEEQLLQKMEEALFAETSQITMIIDESDVSLLQSTLENAFYQSPYLARFTEGYDYEVTSFIDMSLVDFSLVLAEDAAMANSVVKAADLKEAVLLIAEAWEQDPFAPVSILFDSELSDDTVKGLTETAFSISQVVYMPNAFYHISGNTEESNGEIITFSMEEPTFDKALILQKQQELQAAIKTAAAEIYGDGSKSAEDLVYDAVEYLCDRVEYDMEIYDAGENPTEEMRISRSAYGAFVEGSTVCTGYARAFYFLMEELGIPCCVYGGDHDGEGHEWNAVMLGDELYYVDVTFTDTAEDWFYALMEPVFYNTEPYREDYANYWGIDLLPD